MVCILQERAWTSNRKGVNFENRFLRKAEEKRRCTLGLMPVTEQPMMRPWRRTPRYHFGPIRLIFTSLKPAFWNHCTCTRALAQVLIVGGRSLVIL